jgi:hypothetical protein
MDSLRTYIEAEDVVTARWLANTMEIKVSAARTMLEKYKANHNDDSKAFYLLIGSSIKGNSNNNNSSSLYVISEDKLAAKKKTLKKVTSCEIYSLQRDTRSTAIPGAKDGCVLQLYYADTAQEQEFLRQGDNSTDNLLKNAAGCIKPSSKGDAINLRSAGDRAVYSGYSAPRTTSTPAYKPSASSSSSSISSGMKSFATTVDSSPAKVSKKSTVNAANFFGAASAPTSSSAKKSKTTANSATKTQSALKVSRMDTTGTNADARNVKRAETVNPDDDEEEWNDGTGTANRAPNKENLKDRKVAVGMPVGSGGMHQADLDEMEVQKVNEPSSPTAGSKRAHSSVGSGAMDDFATASTNNSNSPKKKKTKMKTVEKMLMDDSGYMITTLVEEEVTDDEDEVRAATAAKKQLLRAQKESQMQMQIEPKNEEAVKSDGKKKTVSKGKVLPSNQTGMMSFFGKK